MKNKKSAEKKSFIVTMEPIDKRSIGTILREKRQELKIEISGISTYLKIRQSDVEAIENDEWKKITKHLYIPGLIHSYAKFLKIDLESIEEKIKLLPIESNTNNKKHQLLNIGENIDLTPSRDTFFNFLLISILLFLTLLSLYNFYEDKSSLLNNNDVIEELKKISSDN